MESEFESKYRQAEAERLRADGAVTSTADAAASRTRRARELSGQIVTEFATIAVGMLRKEGVWCRDSWYLPGIGREVTFTADRHRSGLFRQAWTYESYGFLTLTKGALLRPSTVPLGVSEEDALFAAMEVGGAESWRAFRVDSEMTSPPRLWFNTDSEQLSVVWEDLSGQMQVMPFVDYVATAVESLVAGWRNRTR